MVFWGNSEEIGKHFRQKFAQEETVVDPERAKWMAENPGCVRIDIFSNHAERLAAKLTADAFDSNRSVWRWVDEDGQEREAVCNGIFMVGVNEDYELVCDIARVESKEEVVVPLLSVRSIDFDDELSTGWDEDEVTYYGWSPNVRWVYDRRQEDCINSFCNLVRFVPEVDIYVPKE